MRFFVGKDLFLEYTCDNKYYLSDPAAPAG